MSTGTAPQPTNLTPENIFILAIKEGNFVNQYNFIASDLQAAIDKGRKFCEVSGAKRRFIHVRPFITDFEKKVRDENKAV